MFSEAANISSVSRTKFRLAGGAQPLILAPVHVNGRGPFEFILDTGAGTTLLSPELARKDVDVAITDLSHLGKTVGAIGYNFLKRYKVVIDYPNQIIALLPP